MKSEKRILIAFWLNFSFALLEAIFGFLFRSSAVMADAVHDLGDALAIGLSAYLEKLSKKKGIGSIVWATSASACLGLF